MKIISNLETSHVSPSQSLLVLPSFIHLKLAVQIIDWFLYEGNTGT